LSKVIRHISIDFWSTLYRPNPRFSDRRIDWLLEHFSDLILDRETLSGVIKEVGRHNDTLTDSTGISRNQLELYGEVFSRLGISINEIQLDSVCSELNMIFIENRPELILTEYAALLSRLSESGITLSISSNTAFVSGCFLQKSIQLDGLQDHFEFMVFSDLVGFSKPAFEFYKVVFDRVNRAHTIPLERKNVLHVGDNPIADIQGATSFGFQALPIHTPDDLLKLEMYV
jgi:putative hydrolase of the HAD superfamily